MMIQLRRPHPLLLSLPAAAATIVVLGLATPASAQTFGQLPTAPVVAAPNIAKQRQAAPAALPGAASQSGEVAKPEKPVTDMPPTEALFDAINRGDITTARDAINRGADLGGKNILGMTPTDLSIDLGRNDITFLLLSLRGAFGANDYPSGAPAQPLPASTKPPVTAARGRPATAAATPAPAPAPVHAAAPSPAPRQYATTGGASGGAPIPQMGFLGFGGATQ